jgi:hypothetical protein
MIKWRIDRYDNPSINLVRFRIVDPTYLPPNVNSIDEQDQSTAVVKAASSPVMIYLRKY